MVILVQDLSKPQAFDAALLCPWFLERVKIGLAECQQENLPVEVFEGYRTTARQDFLYAAGRTRDGAIVTRAKGGLSYHQYGLAVDLVFKRNGKWDWNGAWEDVARHMTRAGLEWGGIGDQGHYQVSGGFVAGDALQIVRDYGIASLWQVVFKKAEVRYK